MTSNALNEVGGVDDELHLAMDFDLFLRIVARGASVRVHGCDPRNVRPPRQLEIGREHPRRVPSRGSEVAPRCRPHGARERGARPSKRSRRVALGRTMAARVSGRRRRPMPLAERAGAHLEATRVLLQSQSVLRAVPHATNPSLWRCPATRRGSPCHCVDFHNGFGIAGAQADERRRDPRASDERSCRAGRVKSTALAGLSLSAQRMVGLVAHARHGALGSEVAGPDEFSVWLLIGTLSALAGVMDLGVANGLVTHVARAPASEITPRFVVWRRPAGTCSPHWASRWAFFGPARLARRPPRWHRDRRHGEPLAGQQSLALFALAVCAGLPLGIARESNKAGTK